MFRFTIRDMLWLTVVAAILLGWWLHHRQMIEVSRERDEAVARWHEASQKWLAATRLVRSTGGRMGGGGGMGGGGPIQLPPDDEPAEAASSTVSP